MLVSIIPMIAFYLYQSGRDGSDIQGLINSYNSNYTFEKTSNEPLTYRVSEQGETIGYLTIGSEMGYQSTITIAVFIDINGVIIDTRTLSQDETPAFYKRIEELAFLENAFNNKNIRDGFMVDHNVDAVSQATITSKGITRAVHNASRYVGHEYLQTDVQNLNGHLKFSLVDAAVILILLLAFIAYKIKSKKIRNVILLTSIILIGFKFSQFLSYAMFFTAFTGKWPSLFDDFRWYLLILGALGLNIFTGKNLYCTYVCPFGAFQELQYNTAKLKFFRISPRIRKAFRILPGLIAYIALAAALLTNSVRAMSYEPFSLLYGRLGTDIQWLLLPLILFTAFLVFRFYCHFGCPVGYTLNLLLKMRGLIVKPWIKKHPSRI